MIRYQKKSRSEPDPLTGLPHSWSVDLGDGQLVPWRGFYTGPVALDPSEIEDICVRLLGCGSGEISPQVESLLPSAVGADAMLPALILHSTTPELKALEGELHSLAGGGRGGDLTTYKETRSVYLAQPGDLPVGRTSTWQAAVAASGGSGLELPDRDHYYLSHALLALASDHERGRSSPAMESMLSFIRTGSRRVRLYAFETEMQIFLCWLAQRAGVSRLPVEANRPDVSKTWNRKAVLHPTVEVALDLEGLGLPGSEADARRILEVESACCELTQNLGIKVPRLPGYTLSRLGQDAEGFSRQLVEAADLLRQRYGLTEGCLKASEAGDGARITPGLKLADIETLERLGREAFAHGDDYVLEAHVTYGRPRLAGQELPTSVSAHIRGGQTAPGATVQFVEGTSWKGNVYLDNRSLDALQIPPAAFFRLRQFTQAFEKAFQNQGTPLVLAGIDFAIGTVGGRFGDQALLGAQDLNVSFTGAECLRAFLDKAQSRAGAGGVSTYGVSRVYRPKADADHHAFQRVTEAMSGRETRYETVASVPGRWAMVAMTGAGPTRAVENLGRLQEKLLQEGLIAEP